MPKTARIRVLPALLVLILVAMCVIWGYTAKNDGGLTDRVLGRALSIFPQLGGVAEDTVGFSRDMAVTTPYAAGSPVTDKDERSGVVLNDRSRVFKGYNLYNTARTSAVLLVNMDGDVVYEWDFDASPSFHHFTMDEDGGLYAIENEKRLIRLDKNSRELWSYNEPCHHDVYLGPDGLVYVLVRNKENHPEINFGRDVYVDYIHVLDRDGKFIRKVSFMDMFKDRRFRFLLPSANIFENDIFHANSIAVFDGSLENLDPVLYKRGNILFSLRNINLVGIMNPDSGRLLWAWGPGNIYRQHNATLLDNGNILIFDNGSAVSRVLEVDPVDNSIAWSYGGGTSTFFYSLSRGSAQRLPNGNTLIGVADKGYAIEVTGSGDVVWKFVNPYLFDQDNVTMRGAFYRMTRIQPDAMEPLKDGAGKR